MIHSNATSKPQEVVIIAKNIVNSFRVATLQGRTNVFYLQDVFFFSRCRVCGGYCCAKRNSICEGHWAGRAIIESDSFNVVNFINNKIASRSEVELLISEIQKVLSSSESSFTPRSCNEAIHHLA